MYLVTALGVIVLPVCFLDSWNTDSKAKASGIHKGMTSFEFIITFLSTYMHDSVAHGWYQQEAPEFEH